MILQNKCKLRRWKQEMVYMNKDLIRKQQLKQKQIRAAIEEYRRNSKIVKIGYNKLADEGIVWK